MSYCLFEGNKAQKGSMVSFRTALAPKETNFFAAENSSKKRKYGDLDKDSTHVELQLERPLPLEWQQCLDLQSGQIHFYNTRTQMRTCKDPRDDQEPDSPCKQGTHTMSLELELNLPYDSVSDSERNKYKEARSRRSPGGRSDDPQVTSQVDHKDKPNDLKIPARIPADPFVSSDQSDKEVQEMVAVACMRCHMLVMMCKASPTCPNCKFLHPLDQKDYGALFKPGPGLGLLCCKD